MSSDVDRVPEAGPLAGSKICPTCGTHYLAAAKRTGCPVCLMRGALEAEATSHGGPLGEDRFDHYELIQGEGGGFEELGRGAMGVTYRARDTVLGRAVALKVIDARIATRSEARERFLREARAAARLHHPHVASVFYYGVRQSDGQCFYAMELVGGESLESRLRRKGPLPVGMALEVVAQVARALAAAQAQGLVHRDLKPSNLMLVEEPELAVKVIDFGLAKAAADAASEADLTHGGFVGTPAFASPEQCAAVSVDTRSDLYALGITLWVMLTGTAPFLGSCAEVKEQHLRAPLPWDQLQGLPQPLMALLEALLQKDPARRFQTPVQLLQALAAVTVAVEAGRTLSRHRLHQAPPTDAGALTRKDPPVRRGPKQISIARLPVTGKDVFGREEELAFLDAAWANPQVNLVAAVAWAGVGKSTLVNHWLRQLAAEQYRLAERVFGWSFYRQGTRGDASSADEFLDTALAWFGDPEPRQGTDWEKGERLARLVARRRTLLVLDGLEPLQHPPGPHEGRLREPALQALLRELAAFNRGLCVITTRLPVADLAEHEGGSLRRLELEHLSPEAGAKLLQGLGVTGPEAELRAASQEFQGHCLALTLLGSYLADAYHGDIRRREEISKRLADDARQGAHARKVMESYRIWFGEGPEVAVLRLLGFFDRPADEPALRALLNRPPISGLTVSLTDLSPSEWRRLLAKLRRAKLLAGEDPHQPGQLDAHPLVREYFGEQLRTQRAEAWREGNRRLYHYYRALAPELPESFREMEPLFLAVTCGCQAELYRDALHEVYLPRIQRGDAAFAANVLGARGALLSALVHFFEKMRWDSPLQTGGGEQGLIPEDQLFILSQTALHLTTTRGMGTPEARICHERVESLCRSVRRPLLHYSALIGQWRYSLTSENLTVAMQIARRVHAVAQEQRDPALLTGAYNALACTVYSLGDFEAGRRYATLGIQTWRAGGTASAVEEVDAPSVSCLLHKALSEWHLGEITACHATMAESISLAKELKDMPALTNAVFNAGVLSHFERNVSEAERLASEVIELSTRYKFAFWLAIGSILLGWARNASGAIVEGLSCLEHGIQDYRANGQVLGMPYFLGLKAEALYRADRASEALEAIREAEIFAERSAARSWCAELYRLRGLFLAALGAEEAQIEAAFHQAIRTAQQQKSFSLRKRAEAGLAAYRGR
jgi:hypothetical protein